MSAIFCLTSVFSVHGTDSRLKRSFGVLKANSIEFMLFSLAQSETAYKMHTVHRTDREKKDKSRVKVNYR